MLRSIIYSLLLTYLAGYAFGYSVSKDALKSPARVARELVHQTNWAAIGTISTNSKILSFPMVNVISIDDSTKDGGSSGKIHFMLTNLDFTGADWRVNNKVTLLLTAEQNKDCEKRGEDPEQPTCARVIISGKIVELDQNARDYKTELDVFATRHPDAKTWVKIPGHAFYLCEFEIENIFVLNAFGGAKNVTPEEYYAVQL